MSKIRLWKLGSLEYSLAPTKEAVAKLAEILKGIKEGEDFDLIWGPDIRVELLDGADEDFIIDCTEGAKLLLESQGYEVKLK